MVIMSSPTTLEKVPACRSIGGPRGVVCPLQNTTSLLAASHTPCGFVGRLVAKLLCEHEVTMSHNVFDKHRSALSAVASARLPRATTAFQRRTDSRTCEFSAGRADVGLMWRFSRNGGFRKAERRVVHRPSFHARKMSSWARTEWR